MRDISFTNPNGENRDQLLHKAGTFSSSSPPKLNESLCEKVSFNIGFFAVFIHLIMEYNNDVIGDIPDHEMDDIDDGTQVFGSDTEDGYDDNSSDDLDSNTDSEQEIQTTSYYEIEDTRRKYVMTRLGALLRNFRRKLYAKYIEPNLKNPSKLAVIPKRYRTIILNQEHWNAFVTYTQSKNFKAGEIVDDDVQVIAEKLQEQEQKIKDGELSLDPGEDAMTVVFGKENGSYLKGVGTGVPSTRYFHAPRTKGSSKAVIEELNFKLMNEKREVQKKDQQLEALSTKVTEQAKTLTQVLALLDSQGLKFFMLSICGGFGSRGIMGNIKSGSLWVFLIFCFIIVDHYVCIFTLYANSVEKIVGSTITTDTITTMEQPVTLPIQKKKKKVVESNTATTVPETPSDLPKAVTIEKTTTTTDVPRTGTTDSQIVPKSIKCTLAYPDQRNIVALGEIHLSSERQVIHGVPLQDDCYKVSIEELRKPNSFLPFETGEYKTVGEAFKSFVAWPKYLVKCDPKVCFFT
ncbi:hypothetical protein LXL04_032462 [Taraxacum kok-saghyz]